MASNGTKGCRPKIWGRPLGSSLPKSKAPKGFLIICMGRRGREGLDVIHGRAFQLMNKSLVVRRCFRDLGVLKITLE
jgi:hypothetical protein